MSVLPDRILRGQTSATTIQHLLMDPLQMTMPGERNLLHWVLPPWQRAEVWEDWRKRAFVEGIFLGLGTGFYVAHQPYWERGGLPKPMSGWLIDGQQRLSAIRDFVSGELTVFDGLRYDSLSLPEKRIRFLNQPFPYVEIPYTSDEGVLKDLYMRLNFNVRVSHTEEDRLRVAEAPSAEAQRPRVRG